MIRSALLQVNVKKWGHEKIKDLKALLRGCQRKLDVDRVPVKVKDNAVFDTRLH